MATEVKRAVRVAERVRQELATLLTSGVRDPRLEGVTVSRVEMTDDLRHVRVFVRLLAGAEKRDEALEGLARASGMLRREVTKRVGLRFAPMLAFRYDEAQDKVTRIEELLAEVEAEKKSRDPR